jgi:uncharacterized protein YbjT (DUF2867 family)
VLLSGRGEPEARRCEQIVRDSGLEWTIVRASWFAQNFSESFLLDAVLAGEVALPAGAVGEPFVDADDIADVAVAALTDSRHARQIYEVTGPRLWTFADAVEAIGAQRAERRYERITPDAYASASRRAGPGGSRGAAPILFTEMLDNNASVADGVTRALAAPSLCGLRPGRRASAWDAAVAAPAGEANRRPEFEGESSLRRRHDFVRPSWRSRAPRPA